VKKSLRVVRILLLTSVVAAFGACAAVSDPSEEPTAAKGVAGDELLSVSQSELSANPSLRQRVIEFAKTRIREISRANQTRTDNRAQVTEQLRPYLELLVRVAPERSKAETLQLLLGPWYSLWTNQEFRGNSPNLARIFQVVRQGHYYNLSDSPGPGGVTFINALRGAYAPVADTFAIRFTRNAVLPGSLVGKTGAEVAALAAGIEAGTVAVTPVPGPIGITGQLGVVYVDAELRISDGLQTPVFDDNGNVTLPGESGLLFVLERLDGPLP
jgi:hypothetical protein